MWHKFSRFRWRGISVLKYKETETHFKMITRQILSNSHDGHFATPSPSVPLPKGERDVLRRKTAPSPLLGEGAGHRPEGEGVVRKNHADMAFSPRYFEIQPGGHSTLERHEHAHWVLILRGQGHVLLGDQLIKINPYDTLTIPPMTWHQFQPIGAEPFGFLCVVNQERDRPQLPTEADLKLLCKDKKIQRWIRA